MTLKALILLCQTEPSISATIYEPPLVRRTIIIGPKYLGFNLLFNEILNEIENTGLEDSPDSRDYNFEGVNLDGSSLDKSEDLEEFEESSDEGAWQFFYLRFEVFVLKFDLEKFGQSFEESQKMH